MFTVKCKKDLFMDGAKVASFTKGKTYRTTGILTHNSRETELKESTILIDDQGDDHRIGIWKKHFVISKGD
jgi:ribosomal protein S4E